jgi:prepilin-type N-terminal cleavage/methylation domain-containing protein
MTSTKATQKGFTIIELLTVLSIIIIILSILVPGMNRARIYAKKVTQKSQFHEISKGLELFRNDHQETYPDSGATDTNATPNGYCGAMKLCEAMFGQDGMGLNPSSTFQAKTSVYLLNLCTQIDSATVSSSTTLTTNLRERTKYIESEGVKAAQLKALYSWYNTSAVTNYYSTTASFKTTVDATPPNPSEYPNAVITDVFLRTPSRCGGKKLGMPVLYYKADPTKLVHNPAFDPTAYGGTTTPNPSIYNFDDNYAITGLGCPWEGSPPPIAGGTGTPQPMYGEANVKIFYKAITNTKVTATPRPHNEDGYILLSAGWDNLYGTSDDVYNFSD